MTTRFEMAEALVAEAKKRRSEIGDHGDPYEEALLTGVVSVKLKIIVKEIFDHLRSALDYCAREICEQCSSGSAPKIVYFPIVAKGFKQSDFKSRVGKLMPGVLDARPDVLPVLESFQPFTAADNDWLADFTSLCNENKHEQLSVTQCTSGHGLASKHDDGVVRISTFKNDKTTPFTRTPLMCLHNFPLDGSGEYTFNYISFTAIDEELLWFLDQSIAGVEHIIRELKSKF
jgi:hypothetical protein